jgi:hypothetical protein
MKRKTSPRKPRAIKPTVGACFSFRYPTLPGVIRAEIVTVRNLRRQPLEALTLAMHPNRPRGTTLLTVMDLDRFRLRKVYLEVMTEVQAIDSPKLVLAMFDPSNADEPPQPMPRQAGATITDKFVRMQRANAHAAADPECYRLLCLIPGDSKSEVKP